MWQMWGGTESWYFLVYCLICLKKSRNPDEIGKPDIFLKNTQSRYPDGLLQNLIFSRMLNLEILIRSCFFPIILIEQTALYLTSYIYDVGINIISYFNKSYCSRCTFIILTNVILLIFIAILLFNGGTKYDCSQFYSDLPWP